MPSIRLVLPVLAGVLLAAPAAAQPATSPGVRPVHSLGQPPRYEVHAAGSWLHDGDRNAGLGALGVRRHFLNPVVGLAAGELEAYGTTSGPFAGAGARALFSAPALGLAAGVDWHASAARFDFVASFRTAVRRGGLLGHGTMVRADWLPTRAGSFAIGIQAPLFRPNAGRTRSRDTEAVPERRPVLTGPWQQEDVTARLHRELDALNASMRAIRLYTNLYTDDARAALRAAGPWTRVADDYHRRLAALFAAAANGGVAGDSVAAHARAGLLEHVLLPYNRLFGRPKEDDGIRRLTDDAHSAFAHWLRDSSGITPAARPALVGAHSAWMELVRASHAAITAQWRDDRSVWLPLHLALRESDVDEQAELDTLLGRAVGRPFTDRNATTLLRSGDLPLEIARSIYATRDYHVLWMHDFAGIREENGTLDRIGYEMVADAYLPALTEAVRRYDATGRLPVYLVFLDQFFYEPRNGRLWMSILENPMYADVALPGDNAAREAHLRQRQAELRAAVAASTRLQQEARTRGDGWLRRNVKVHVSITNPSDFSFRSHRIVPPFPFVPDNIIRDHRKLAFHDLNEADPYAGALYLMGVGVGEHYASETWEDRGYRVRGPAALEARAAARRLLRQHGFSDDEIPLPLREVTDTDAAERRMANGEYVGRALQVHNEVGFGPKHSSVTRALMYDLAQPGSIIVVPDPIWVSAEWAGMLAAAAARGARVQVIAPAKENAPSPQAPLLAMAHEVVSRLVALQSVLAAHEGAGVLRVGLFASRVPVGDVAGRRREVREGLARAPWIRELIPFDARALAVLEQAEAVVATSPDASAVARDTEFRPPQLHQKTQLIARPGAVAALLRRPGWEDAIADAFVSQARQTARFAEILAAPAPVGEGSATSSESLLRGYEQTLTEAERKQVSFYFTAGTQNQDPRGLMLDGEATLIVSGIPAASGLVDLFFLMARTTWVESPAEIDRLLPPPGGFMRRVARWIRPAL